MTDREPFRVLVTGSRTASPGAATLVRRTLSRVCADAISHGRPVVIVQGECPYGGVDLVARDWAEASPGVTSEGHPAEWGRYGKGAGMIRNSHMVKLGADICLAFPAPESRGTWDCLKKAAAAGIPGRIYPLAAATPPDAP